MKDMEYSKEKGLHEGKKKKRNTAKRGMKHDM